MYAYRRPGSREENRRRLLRPQAIRALVLAAAVLLVLLALFARHAVGSSDGGYETVVVQPGDTLWGIAAVHYPDADVRERVDTIMADNTLGRPVIHPGDKLRLRHG